MDLRGIQALEGWIFMVGRLLTGMILLLPLAASGQEDGAFPAQVQPWPDVRQPVLSVEHVPDLKSLLAVQAALRELAAGHQVRLLGVTASQAWFVADDLGGKGWREVLAHEPRCRQTDKVASSPPDATPEPGSPTPAIPAVETCIWEAEVAVQPALPPTALPPVQSPL